MPLGRSGQGRWLLAFLHVSPQMQLEREASGCRIRCGEEPWCRLGGCQPGVTSPFWQLALSCLRSATGAAAGEGRPSQAGRRTLAAGRGPPRTIHAASSPLLRGKGPVAQGFGASREDCCPRSDCTPKRWRCTHTHAVPLRCHTQRKAEHGFTRTTTCTATHTRVHTVRYTPAHAGAGSQTLLAVALMQRRELLESFSTGDRGAGAGSLEPKEA